MAKYVEIISKSSIWGANFLMIFITLGTQDRSFKRLLDAVQKQIDLKNITEEVIVQAGETIYQSKDMKILQMIRPEEYSKYINDCRILITHGGVGTIVEALKKHKKVIAAARLKEYEEHQNNHQKQIIHEFVKDGLILELENFDELDLLLKEIETFEPKEYVSHTNEMISILDEFIEEKTKDGKGNKFRKFMMYGFFGFFAILLELIIYLFLSNFTISFLTTVCISSFLILLYRLIMHRIFRKDKSLNVLGEFIFLLIISVELGIVFGFPNYFANDFIFKKIILSVISGIVIYFLILTLQVKDVE